MFSIITFDAIHSIPDDLFSLIMDYADEAIAPNEVNSLIRAKAKNILNLMLVSKKMNQYFKHRLIALNERILLNIIKADEYRKPLVGIYPPLIEAAMDWNKERFIALLRVEDVNQTDKHGRTPLHVAAGMDQGAGKLELVRMLIQHPGLDRSIRTLKGKTAKDLTKNLEITSLL